MSCFIDCFVLFDVLFGVDLFEDVFLVFVGSIWIYDFSIEYIYNENVDVYVGLRNVFNKVLFGYMFDLFYDLFGCRLNVGIIVCFE